MTDNSGQNAPLFRADIRRGEIYWMDWSPGRGSEQTGVRPALIIQSDAGNANPWYDLTVVATISTKGKAHIPTHIELLPTNENGLRETSYVKAEQILTVTKSRLRERLGNVSPQEMQRVEVALKKAQGLS